MVPTMNNSMLMSRSSLRESLRRIIPTPGRRVLHWILGRMYQVYDQVYEAAERLAYPLRQLPPRRLRTTISPLWFDFRKAGWDQLEFFTEVAGLQPSDRFLDIACGVGRVAIPLARFLNNHGSYEGF